MSGPLADLSVVVDVQHLYRSGIFAKDRGAIYTLATGAKVSETDALATGAKVSETDLTLQYGAMLRAFLEDLGAKVWSNDPANDLFVGPYSRRQRMAMKIGAGLYLACHMNAGGGEYALVEHMSDGAEGSAALAATIARELDEAIPEVSTGKVRALKSGERGSVCIRYFTSGPSLILEPLFGDQWRHQPLLNAAGMTAVANAIGRGVVAGRRALHPLPPAA